MEARKDWNGLKQPDKTCFRVIICCVFSEDNVISTVVFWKVLSLAVTIQTDRQRLCREEPHNVPKFKLMESRPSRLEAVSAAKGASSEAWRIWALVCFFVFLNTFSKHPEGNSPFLDKSNDVMVIRGTKMIESTINWTFTWEQIFFLKISNIESSIIKCWWLFNQPIFQGLQTRNHLQICPQQLNLTSRTSTNSRTSASPSHISQIPGWNPHLRNHGLSTTWNTAAESCLGFTAKPTIDPISPGFCN